MKSKINKLDKTFILTSVKKPTFLKTFHSLHSFVIQTRQIHFVMPNFFRLNLKKKKEKILKCSKKSSELPSASKRLLSLVLSIAVCENIPRLVGNYKKENCL
jgi:hypothetical protein